MKKLILFAALLVAITATSAMAEIKVAGNASVGVFTDYIWRGVNYTGDANFVVQPSVTVGTGDVSVNWWGNMNENTGDLDEVDLTVDYSKDLGPVSVSVGNILYNVDGATDTNELYLAVAPNGLPLDAKLTTYVDYDEVHAYYMTLALGKSLEVADKTTLNLGAAVGYNDFNYFQNAELSASVSYALNEQLSVTPSLLYSAPLTDRAKNRNPGLDDVVVAGIAIGLDF